MEFQNTSPSLRTLQIVTGRSVNRRAQIESARVPPRGVVDLSPDRLRMIRDGATDSAGRARLQMFLQDFKPLAASTLPISGRIVFGEAFSDAAKSALDRLIDQSVAAQDAPQIETPNDRVVALTQPTIPRDDAGFRGPKGRNQKPAAPALSMSKDELDELIGETRSPAPTSAAEPVPSDGKAPDPSSVVVGGRAAGPTAAAGKSGK